MMDIRILRIYEIHAVISCEVLPLSIKVGPGNDHYSKYFMSLLEGLRVKYSRSRPKEVTEDST